MAENKDKDIVMKCRHMEKVYPGTKALDDVDFNIYRGKVNVLSGRKWCRQVHINEADCRNRAAFFRKDVS